MWAASTLGVWAELPEYIAVQAEESSCSYISTFLSHRRSTVLLSIARHVEKDPPRPGIEPGPSTWQAEILTTRLSRNHFKWMVDINTIVSRWYRSRFLIKPIFFQQRSCGGVVNASDSKSDSLWERRFESYQLRFFCQREELYFYYCYIGNLIIAHLC